MADITRLGNIATQLELLASITPEDGLRLEKTEEAKLQRMFNALVVVTSEQLTALIDLSDVDDTMSPETGHVLAWDGTSWTSGVVGEGGAALSLDDLLDVDAPSPTTGQFIAYNATTTKWEPATVSTPPAQKVKNLLIQYPQDGDAWGIWYTNTALTVDEVQAARVGGTDIEWTLYHGDEILSTNTTILTSTDMSTGAGDNHVAFSDATVPANKWISYVQGTTSGTPTQMSISVFYTED